MSLEQKITLVIVAGGSGSRFGGELPKQFRLLGDLPVWAWSVRALAPWPGLIEILVAMDEQWFGTAGKTLSALNLPVPYRFVPSGERRQDTVMNALREVNESSDLVAVHDGARPFPPSNLVEITDAASQNGGAIFALPATDATKQVDKFLTIQRTVPRENLWLAQTPQVFRRKELTEGLTWCNARELTVSDEASVAEAVGLSHVVVPGSRLNLKITYPEDWNLAVLLATQMKERF